MQFTLTRMTYEVYNKSQVKRKILNRLRSNEKVPYKCSKTKNTINFTTHIPNSEPLSFHFFSSSLLTDFLNYKSYTSESAQKPNIIF